MNSRFLGKIKKKTYYWKYDDKIGEELNTIEYKTIFELDLERPPLEENDNFYITEIDDYLYIQKAMRGVDENNKEIMVYIVNKTLEIIEDEETEKSLKKAQTDIENYFKRKEQEKKDLESMSKKYKKWYQFWK